MNADEYEPTGEPDIISEDDQKLLDFFNGIEKGYESYAKEDGWSDEDIADKLEGKIDWEWNKLPMTKRKQLALDAGVNEEWAEKMSRKQDWQDANYGTDMHPTYGSQVEAYMRSQGTVHESYANEEDIFTWISTKLGLKPRKQTTYGPKEIPDNRPKEKPMLCTPSEIYDHKSGKCIPKYMAPWRLRNEAFTKDKSVSEWWDQLTTGQRQEIGFGGYRELRANWDDLSPITQKGVRREFEGESYAKEYSNLSSWSEDKLTNQLEDDKDALSSTGEWRINEGIDEIKDELKSRGYIFTAGGGYAKEDYGESKDKCMTCGKVFDVADNDGIIAHVRKHKEEQGDNYEPDFTGIKNEASNPKGGNLERINKIYNEMARIVDPDMTGDVNTGYGQSMISDMAQKHNLSEYQIQEIWDSGGTTDIDVSNEIYNSENEKDDMDDAGFDPDYSYSDSIDWDITTNSPKKKKSQEGGDDDFWADGTPRRRWNKDGSEKPDYDPSNDPVQAFLAKKKKDYGEEEIIEKKFTPPKILYYKQYKLGRRANVKSHFGNEVSIERLREVEKWWGKTRVAQGYPHWKEMNIINRQRAIVDFLNNAPIHEAYAKERFYEENAWECSHDDIDDASGRGDYQCKICGASQGTMNAYADIKEDAMAGKLDKFENYSRWSDVEKQGYDYIKDQYDFSTESYSKTVYQRIINEVEEPYGARDEYEALKNVDTTGMSEEEIDGYYERLDELRTTLGEAKESCASCGKTEDKYGKQHDKDWRCEKCEMEDYFDKGNEDYSDAEKEAGYGEYEGDDWRDNIPAGTKHCEKCGRPLMSGKKCDNCGTINEGGRGSGKRGHAGWMRSLEEASDYKECPNCKVMTDQYGGKCQLCGKKVPTVAKEGTWTEDVYCPICKKIIEKFSYKDTGDDASYFASRDKEKILDSHLRKTHGQYQGYVDDRHPEGLYPV